MVGPWPLAPHHDHLQYIHHIHLMQRGQNWGVTDTLSHMRKELDIFPFIYTNDFTLYQGRN